MFSQPFANSTNYGRWRARALCCCALVPLVSGCASELETSYGSFSSAYSQGSVNGTDVLAEMFREAGHEVVARHSLINSDQEETSTIIWFPNDYAAPSFEVCDWFDEWLAAKPGRTLIYVGRDFDAAPLYWRKMLAQAPDSQKDLYRQQETMARLSTFPWKKPDENDLECEWFEFESKPRKTVARLHGSWSAGIDANRTEIELGYRLMPLGDVQRLLTSGASGEDTLVFRHAQPHWSTSKLLAIVNGSFLLNVPLVNREHRKLAGKLIASVTAGRTVFLQSGPGGPPINPTAENASLWRFFAAWPLNVILLQMAVLGVIFCYSRWPILGRPKNPPPEATSDFGKHVDAVGRLLRRTGDREFALSKLPQTSDPSGH